MKKEKSIQEIRNKIKKQFPKNIEEYTIEELKEQYSLFERRHPVSSIEVLVYWENLFCLDWGEPECFACKNLTFNRDGAKRIKKDHNFSVWSQIFEQCHIVSACYGGPAEAWNIVYLCNYCHKVFDSFFAGHPNQYYKSIQWLQQRRKSLLEYMSDSLIQYSNHKKIKLDLINGTGFIQITQSDEAFNPQSNHYIIGNKMDPADVIIARYKYAIDYMANGNLIRTKFNYLNLKQSLKGGN